MRYSHLVILFIALSACTRQQAGHSFRVDNEDGVPTAITSGGPKFTQSLFRYEKVLTLKQDPAIEESMLYRPGSICLDQGGYYYVVDSAAARVAVFDSLGNYVRSFGGRGDGPGEFRSMSLLHFYEDVMSFHDSQNLRTTRYRTDGTLLEIVVDPKRRSRFQRLHRVPGDRLLYELNRDLAVEGAGLDDAFSWMGSRVLITNADDDTLTILNTPWVKRMYTFSSNTGSGASRMAYSGSPEALYVPGQGILLCTGVTPDIDWYDLDGNPTRRLRLGLDPEPVTAEEREAIQQRMQESYEGDQDRSPPGMAVLRRDKLKFHDYKAFWNRVEVDDEGYLWLGIPEEPGDRAPQDGRLNRVISPAGEYLGDSRWPCRSGSVFRGMFLGQVEDEYTGEMVPTVFRIVPIVAGLDYP